MNREIRFKSLNELYKRLYPALNTRKNAALKEGISISEHDIWLLLKNSKWDNNEKLSLYDMVNDILYLENEDIINYLHKEGAKIEN